MARKIYDLAIIGGGPGGYVAAIKAAQLGLDTVCIESRASLGGTCLNVGCIPSKALLNASEKYREIPHLTKFGIHVKDLKIDLNELMAKKTKIVAELTQGINFLFKKNKVHRIEGRGEIIKVGYIKVTNAAGQIEELEAKNILIATGSVSAELPGIHVDEKTIVSSTGALSLPKIPKKLIVIGGGYIGLEMASVWARLGTHVTVVEYMDMIVPMMDHEVARALHKSLEKQGLIFKLSTKVDKVTSTKTGVKIGVSSTKEPHQKETLTADIVLVAVGRRPYTTGLGLEKIGLHMDERGFIKVNAQHESSVPGIYAIGDVTPGPMLAHKAEEEGVAVVENIVGQHGHVNYEAIPGVIYTMPEVAGVGKTEEELKKEGREYSVGKFSFSANSRARANDLTEGFVKILADKKTDRLLGAHIIGADAGTLISEFVLAIEYKAASEDIARTCHPHPTTSEALKEAALATFFKAIHS